jgi:peptidoglycan/xylan/chitin deacetylase (PgdA/CDA1 family)
MIKDHFDVLYEEGASSGKVMAIALHPMIMGAPSRIKYLDKALQYIKKHTDVWFTTGSEIADWYYEHYL